MRVCYLPKLASRFVMLLPVNAPVEALKKKEDDEEEIGGGGKKKGKDKKKKGKTVDLNAFLAGDPIPQVCSAVSNTGHMFLLSAPWFADLGSMRNMHDLVMDTKQPSWADANHEIFMDTRNV